MKERASLTNAVVSILPAPIKNPRRDCNMKNPPRFRTHLEGWRPTVALAGHIVVATFAGLRLVGGTVRSSQDASEQLTRQIVVSMCFYCWTVVLFADFGEQPTSSVTRLRPPMRLAESAV